MPPPKNVIPSADGPQKPVSKPELWGFPGYLTPEQQHALTELRSRVVSERLFVATHVPADASCARATLTRARRRR